MLLIQSFLLHIPNPQIMLQWRLTSLISKPSLLFPFHSKHADFAVSYMGFLSFPFLWNFLSLLISKTVLESHLLQNLAQSMPIFLNPPRLSLDNSVHTSTMNLARWLLEGCLENYCSVDFSACARIFCKFHEIKKKSYLLFPLYLFPESLYSAVHTGKMNEMLWCTNWWKKCWLTLII